MVLALAAMAAGLAHCGPPAASCTQSMTMNGVTASVCVEATGLTPELENAYRMQCTMLSTASSPTTYAGGLCTRVNAVGGCRRMFGTGSNGFVQTSWFYSNTPGVTVDFVQMFCTRASSEFVAP